MNQILETPLLAVSSGGVLGRVATGVDSVTGDGTSPILALLSGE